jgi:3-methyladenine DNA glycosylase AlkD
MSADRWWRRTAIVSTVALNSRTDGGAGDAQRTLAVCRPVAADRDDMVQKALSWALRQLTTFDPAAVQAFLAEQDTRLSALVKREVRNKLRTGLKNPSRA